MSRQNSAEKSVFCLLCSPQALDLGAGVDKIRQEARFLSTLGAARTGFGAWGRTFYKFLENLFYFRSRAGDF